MRGGGGKICDWPDVGNEGGKFRMAQFLGMCVPLIALGTEKQNRVGIVNLTLDMWTLRCSVCCLHRDVKWPVGYVNLDFSCE